MKNKDLTNLALCAAAIALLYMVFGPQKPTAPTTVMAGHKRKRILNEVV